MKNTVVTIQQMKEKGEKISMLTAYDYSTAKLEDEAGVNTILVGDSLGNVILGYEDTISVTMEDMIHHGAAVARGAKNALVVVDMPFMSYQTSVYDAVVNAGRLMKEGRAGAVKLEGGKVGCVRAPWQGKFCVPGSAQAPSVPLNISPSVWLRQPCADLRSACRGECYLAVPLIRLAIRSTPCPVWEKAFIVVRLKSV